MQILEQLACGYDLNVTTESVLTECASMQGYLECMMEMSEAEVVTEGVNLKNIVDKVIKFIQSIVKKIKGLGMKVISFLKGKFKKKRSDEKPAGKGLSSSSGTVNHDSTTGFTNDDKKSDNSKVSHSGMNLRGGTKYLPGREDNYDSDNDAGNTRSADRISGSSRVGITQKDEQLMLVDVLKTMKYTGPHPNGINRGLSNVMTFVNATIGRNVSNKLSGYIRSLTKLIEVGYSDRDGLTDEDYDDIIKKLSNPKFIIEDIFECKDSGWESLKGKISGPNDIAKGLNILYDEGKEGGFYYTNKTFDGVDDIEFFYNAAANAGNKLYNDYSSLLVDTVEENLESIERQKKKCEDLLNKFKEKEFTNPQAQIAINKLMDVWNIVSAANVSALSGIVNVINKAEFELDTIRNFTLTAAKRLEREAGITLQLE